jgi:hypothetical protein
MPRKLGPKLILSLTVLIVAISGVSGYLNLRTQKKQLVAKMILGADQLSNSITSGNLACHARRRPQGRPRDHARHRRQTGD